MRRRLLIGLTLLGSLATALGIGLLSVPYEFQEGEIMSAAGMNANLDAAHGRIRAASDSLATSRLVQLDFTERLDEAFPAAQSASHDEPAGNPSLQQTSPSVEPGSLADPTIVNRFFSDFADQLSEADELTHVIVEELQALSERLTAAEQAFGLTVNERAEAVVAEYAPPEFTVFVRNARTVPDQMNDNFTAVVTSLKPVEQNAAEVADWLEHERARLLAVEDAAGVGDPGEPGAVFQAAVGYLEPPVGYESVSDILVLFAFEPESPGEVAAVTVTGPPGWNLDQPFELNDGHRYGQGLHRALELPGWTYLLDGEYTVTAKVGNKEYTVTSTVDTSLRFTGIPGLGEELYVDDVDEDGIHLNWDPVAGAVTYEVWYSDAETVEDFAPVTWVTRETSFTIPTPRSEINEKTLDRYSMRVYPRNYDMDSVASMDFSIQPREAVLVFRLLPWSGVP